MRLFTALELPRHVLDTILACQDGIPGARWQTANQLHLTLNFIGQVEKHRVSEIQALVEQDRFEPFSMQLAGAGHFGRRAVWFGIRPAAPVIGLHQQQKAQLLALGFPQEAHKFRPHITAARLPRDTPQVAVNQWVEAHRTVTGPAFEVCQLALYASTPGPNGSRYKVIARSPSPHSPA